MEINTPVIYQEKEWVIINILQTTCSLETGKDYLIYKIYNKDSGDETFVYEADLKLKPVEPYDGQDGFWGKLYIAPMVEDKKAVVRLTNRSLNNQSWVLLSDMVYMNQREIVIAMRGLQNAYNEIEKTNNPPTE